MFSLAAAAAGAAVDLHRAMIVAAAALTGCPANADPLVANIVNALLASTAVLLFLFLKANSPCRNEVRNPEEQTGGLQLSCSRGSLNTGLSAPSENKAEPDIYGLLSSPQAKRFQMRYLQE